MTTTSALIIKVARTVSASQTSRSVRGVGCCSIVTAARLSQVACASGAISAASVASTATEPWRPIPRAARPPAIRFACSWTSRQVNRTGSATVPAVKCRGENLAVADISRVNTLTDQIPFPCRFVGDTRDGGNQFRVRRTEQEVAAGVKVDRLRLRRITTTRRPPCPAAPPGRPGLRRCAVDTEAAAHPSAGGTGRSADRHGRWASAVQPIGTVRTSVGSPP